MDSHFIGRFLQRGKYKDTPDISISDVITTIKNNPNYKEGLEIFTLIRISTLP